MPKQQLYKKYAKFYDKIYANKNYDEDVFFIKKIVDNFKVKGNKILDIACGTGTHAKKLSDNGFKITGVDINSEMLKIAKDKAKKAIFLEGSMQSFKSKEKFDIVVCLFTAINYNKSISELEKTIKNFYTLLNKGGILIFDLGLTWIGTPNKRNGINIETYVEDKLEIARISLQNSSKKANIYNSNYLIFIKENGKVDFEIDEHELGIFSVNEIKLVMEKIGFKVNIYDNYTLNKYSKKSKRPVFVGQK